MTTMTIGTTTMTTTIGTTTINAVPALEQNPG